MIFSKSFFVFGNFCRGDFVKNINNKENKMKVQCVDDSARPESIPLSLWIKKGEPYTVINAFKDMHGVLLFQLEEIDLTLANTLYKGFASSRFKPLETTEQEIKREVEEPQYV